MKLIVLNLSLVVSFGLVGCTQSLFQQATMEKRVIEQFADALEEENEPALRRISSSKFENVALRSDDVLTDLRVLHLPSGELSIVEVTDMDDGAKEVIVKEESGGKYQFHLVRDPVKKYWVVDDVLVRQKKSGTRTTKSTTEVMDLLVTLRQFLSVWESGSREEILAMTSPELTKSLSPLPDEWLQSLTAKIASNYEEGMAKKPEANLDDDEAVVKLPSRNGHILLSITRNSGRWLVDDVEAHNHREEHKPGSVKRQADAINAVNAFLTAYANQDSQTLEAISNPNFYNSSLKMADLSLVALPKASDVATEFDLRAFEQQLTFMISAGAEVLRVDLEEPMINPLKPRKDAPSRFLVKDVTLHERSTGRQRSLSSIFTAPTRASLFLKALVEQDIDVLNHVSTPEFSKSIWKRLSPQLVSQLPIPNFETTGLTLTDSHSLADTTELEFTSGSGRLIACRMLTQNGQLRVDDIQFPDENGQVVSLKTRLELAIPVLEFANAWQNRDMESLQKSCSSDFNRLVWSHIAEVPKRFASAAVQLRQPITDTRVTPERATVRIGRDSSSSVTASLIMEHDLWVVDEVRLMNGPQQVVGVRETLRGEIADQLLSGSYSRVHSDDGKDRVVPVVANNEFQQYSEAANGIEQVSGEFSGDYNKGAVSHAVYTRDGSLGKNNGAAAVTPAVRTRNLGGGQMAITPNSTSGIQTAGYQRPANPALQPRPQAARSSDGMQVFGPNANAVANSFDQILGNEFRSSASPPRAAIDMTGDTQKSDDDLMYFGPDKDQLKNKSTAPAKPVLTRPRRITQPADAPISIE